jgi:uncharacterized LabA/DUF88 family protein
MMPTRLMVFYDGSFFRQGQVYFRYHERRGWFCLPELHAFFEAFASRKMGTQRESTKVVEAHFYDGRTSSRAADSDRLEKERDFEMALISAGIVPHYLPVAERPRVPGSQNDGDIMQKGVDVKMALDALDLAHSNRFDVAVLVTGDADFVPLVTKITALGKQALVAHFEVEPWTDERGKEHRATRASRALLNAASYTLNFNGVLEDPEWPDAEESLFFQPRGG